MSSASRDRDFRDRTTETDKNAAHGDSDDEVEIWGGSKRKEEVKPVQTEEQTEDIVRKAIRVLQKLQGSATAFLNPEERRCLQKVKEVHGVGVTVGMLQKILQKDDEKGGAKGASVGKSTLAILGLAGKVAASKGSSENTQSKNNVSMIDDEGDKLIAFSSKPASKSLRSKVSSEWDEEMDTMAGEQDDLYLLGQQQSRVNEKGDLVRVKQQALQPTWREKRVEEMSEKDWRVLMEDFQIACRGRDVPKPLRYWGESGLSTALLEAIRDAGFKDPSPIQRATLPAGLARRDIIGVAQTGSGKTLAFLLPQLTFVSEQPRLTMDSAQDGPYAVIMTPSRELAQQIHTEAERFGRYVGTRSVCVIGGQSMMEQVVESSVAEILVATPGRLCDLLRQALLVLNQCHYIILDEADKMLDMGFEPQIQEVMAAMPSTNTQKGAGTYRQTIMFSATMPPKIEQLAKMYLRDPVHLTIGSRSKLADRVTQHFELVTEQTKQSALARWLGKIKGPVMVFCNQKTTCDAVARIIQSNRHRCGVIHSGKSQQLREEALELFKSGKNSVQVATDVVGRGIDVRGVQLVINYEMPQGPTPVETYTHRVGRTGRGLATGTAVSFVTDGDRDMMPDLCKQLKESGVAIPKFMKHFVKEEEQILW